MKKAMLCAFGLAVLATPAFASFDAKSPPVCSLDLSLRDRPTIPISSNCRHPLNSVIRRVGLRTQTVGGSAWAN